MTLRNLEYIWLWSDIVQRGIYITLALMLAYTVFALIRFLRCYRLARLRRQRLQSKSWLEVLLTTRDLISELSRGLRILRGIGSAAPFLGLAGTSYGILAEFYGFGMSRSSVIEYLLKATPSRLVTAGAGIFVAVPAVLTHNILRGRVEKMKRELRAISKAEDPTARPFRRAQTLPLRLKFSCLPSYPIVAVPVFATVVIVYMLFRPYIPVGLRVGIPTARCDNALLQPLPNRLLVLQIKNSGEAFINMERIDWKNLRRVLGDIYGARQQRVLYLFAEDEVPFQTVAEAIDIAKNLPGPGSDPLDIKVILLTPRASRECVPVPIRIIPVKPALR